MKAPGGSFIGVAALVAVCAFAVLVPSVVHSLTPITRVLLGAGLIASGLLLASVRSSVSRTRRRASSAPPSAPPALRR